ncbi:RNA 2'-phosphotransferase [Dictyobacter aurantiacus]|uniref:Probable RNA 2'-phosphotransferase n=1 Tax=Dictyobacter aurantiacus TaxID=1936993 RepID=A0A401ZBL4_9CHLR|nr:RNA 2'-phosphotransferase [Dictyobacter aurantiacus]GCE04108.1 putative RNA 2'-phosphotransferase [Dictyobacter aurantiacus]
MEIDLQQLSRTMAYALRHQPANFGLTLDDEGWVSVDALVSALRQHRTGWKHLQVSDIEHVIALPGKKRYELRTGRIRAYYGHSLQQRMQRETAVPPARLFHGTTPAAYERICQSGLLPMGRQYVHLSEDRETALQVARRRTSQPVILVVAALEAYQDGVQFYLGNESVWLADAIPPIYLTRQL